MTIWAVLAAAAAAFVLGGAYNTVFGKRLAALSEAAAAADQPPWKLAIELCRCLLMAAVVAGLAARGDIDEWAGGLLLGLVLWIGFPFVLWTGAVIWENVPRALAAIHAGDWLAKLLAVAVIVSIWQ
jgi:Protein of unknown function (DUF1761)